MLCLSALDYIHYFLWMTYPSCVRLVARTADTDEQVRRLIQLQTSAWLEDWDPPWTDYVNDTGRYQASRPLRSPGTGWLSVPEPKPSKVKQLLVFMLPHLRNKQPEYLKLPAQLNHTDFLIQLFLYFLFLLSFKCFLKVLFLMFFCVALITHYCFSFPSVTVMGQCSYYVRKHRDFKAYESWNLFTVTAAAVLWRGYPPSL